MHPVCTCGSDEFIVEFRTTAQLLIAAGEPLQVTYGPVGDAGLFSTVTCGGCGSHIDIDNSVTGRVLAAPLKVAREVGANVAQQLPSVTVRSRSEGGSTAASRSTTERAVEPGSEG